MTVKREHWGSRLGFILAAAGSAIGLGTMWMLPYVMGQNGGGAFILVFFAFTIAIGIPLFICELMLGRHSQRGVVGTFAHFKPKSPFWKYFGWMGVICTYLVAGWYAVVAGWGLNYIWLSLTNAFADKTTSDISVMYEGFRASGELNVFWQLLFLLLTASIVLRGISKGIEKYAKVLTSVLFIFLILLAAYSATLPGFGQAVDYILVPDFSKLNATSILKALSLSLFALSLGEGIMVTYGSYMSSNDDIPKTASIVGVAIVGISVLVSLMIFPMVFTLGLDPLSGEGLIFKTLPYVFEKLPGSIVISTVFFSLLVFAAITSSVAQIEVIVANHVDLHGWSRKQSVLIAIVFCFLIGLPVALSESAISTLSWKGVFHISYLETLYVLIDWMLCIFALATALFVGWVIPRAVRESGFKLGSTLTWLFPLWSFFIRWLVPSAIVAVILQQAQLL